MKIQGNIKNRMWELAACIVFILIALFLLNPAVRAVPASLIFYTIQGIIFGISFLGSTLLIKKLFPKFTEDHSIPILIIIGFFCGALSAMPNIGISWLGDTQTFSTTGAITHYGIEKEINAELIKYVVLCSCLGAILGVFEACRMK